MVADAWFPFNVGDYLSNTLHLTARQHGGYILLICAAFKARGALPGSDVALASIAKLSPREWREDGDTLKAFLTRQGDEWVHERVLFEWNEAQSRTEAKSAAGKMGAAKRWQGRAKGKSMAPPSGSHRQNDTHLQQQEPPSEPIGSDADDPPDVMAVVFSAGLAWLKKASGKPEPQCRSLLGKWRKDFGADEALVAALGRAQRECTFDPVGWMTKAIQFHKRDRRNGQEGMQI